MKPGDDQSALTQDFSPTDDSENLTGVRVALVGRFGGMNHRDAASVLRSFGAEISEPDPDQTDWIVIGAEESPLAEAELISGQLRDAAASGKVEILQEMKLWQRLGLVDIEHPSKQYYTSVSLAHLLGVSVRVIRRWHRRGLITPVQTLHRLHYFDFQEVATARRLAGWIASGASPKAIEQSLVELVEILPDVQRPLDQLSILVEGKQVLLRGGEGLVETGGQLRFDFQDDDEPPATLSIFDHHPAAYPSLADSVAAGPTRYDPVLERAFNAEDDGDLAAAIDHLHIAMGQLGPRPDWCFQLAELLYRNGEVAAARERYYMTIELDPQSVEARASLGNVLAETGQPEMAVSAFRGALSLHEEYPDAHFQLARTLDAIDQGAEAVAHWKRFLQLAPESPWADEARARLNH